VQDLLPAALKLGAVDGQLAGLPFELDLEHLVYNTTLIPDTPHLWTDVLSNGVSYQFPAKGRKGRLSDASLSHYLSAGARLVNEEGAPKVDEAALLDTLNFYQHALEQGIIDADILNVSESDEQWEQFLSGKIGMTHVSAHRYLSDRRMLNDAQPGAIPSAKGAPVTIGHGWVFALVTSDPSRQNHALKLIETFMQTDVNASWATRSAVIPTRQSAFALVANDDPYWLFLNNYLQVTIPQPAFEGFGQLSRALQQAVEQVINGETSPDEAVQNAVADLE
jgi:ABC-type glycerol-3-phosphate transport system substrate-binding protein